MAYGLELYNASGTRTLGGDYWMPAELALVDVSSFAGSSLTVTYSYPEYPGGSVSVEKSDHVSLLASLGVDLSTITYSISYSSGYPVITFTRNAAYHSFDGYRILLTNDNLQYGIRTYSAAGNLQAGGVSTSYYLWGVFDGVKRKDVEFYGTTFDYNVNILLDWCMNADSKYKHMATHSVNIPYSSLPKNVRPLIMVALPTYPDGVNVYAVYDEFDYFTSTNGQTYRQIVLMTSGAFTPRVYVFVSYKDVLPVSSDSYGLSVVGPTGRQVFNTSQKPFVTLPTTIATITHPGSTGCDISVLTSDNFPIANMPSDPIVNINSIPNAWSYGGYNKANYAIKLGYCKFYSKNGNNVSVNWKNYFTGQFLSGYTTVKYNRAKLNPSFPMYVSSRSFYD